MCCAGKQRKTSVIAHLVAEVFVQQLSGPENMGLHGPEGQAEDLGDILIFPFLDVAQFDDPPVFRGK